MDHDLIGRLFSSRDPLLIRAAQAILEDEKRLKLKRELDEALKDLTRI